MTEIEADEKAVEALGWVRDMYAWSYAVARLRLIQDMPEPPLNPLMVQPPADKCVLLPRCCAAARRSLAGGPQELGQGVDTALHLGARGAQQVRLGGLGGAFRALPARRLHCGSRGACSLTSGRTAAGSTRRARAASSASRSLRSGRRACTCRHAPDGLLYARPCLTRRHVQTFFENGAPVTPEGLELMRLLVHTFNAAVDTLPELPKARLEHPFADATLCACDTACVA